MIFTIIYWLLLVILITRIFVKLTAGRCKSNVCLVGKTVLITGGNAGLGLETAMALAGRGCRLIIADKDNCDESKERIIKETHNTNIVTKYLDLASLDSVRAFAKEINETEERLDILVNNAGISTQSDTYTKDGLLTIMQVNYFGPFLLTHLLIGLLKKSAPSRIVFLSSILAFTTNLDLTNINTAKNDRVSIIGHPDMFAYGNTKLCVLMASNRFAKYLKDLGVTSNSLHPGFVVTTIYSKYIDQGRISLLLGVLMRLGVRLIGKNVQEGAQTAINCCLANELQNVSGKYFIDCRPFPIPYKARDEEFGDKVWEATEKYVKLKPEEKLKN